MSDNDRIYKSISALNPLFAWQIGAKTGAPPVQVARILLELQLKNLIENIDGCVLPKDRRYLRRPTALTTLKPGPDVLQDVLTRWKRDMPRSMRLVE